MPDLPVAQSPLPAQAIHSHFASRPAFFSVVFKALRAGIRERYPLLRLDLLTLKLASPTATGGYTFPTLISVAAAHALNPRLLDLQPQNNLPYYLSPTPGSRLPDIDMQVIAQIIDELPGSLTCTSKRTWPAIGAKQTASAAAAGNGWASCSMAR